MVKFLNKAKVVLLKPLVLTGIGIVVVVGLISYSNRGTGPAYETVMAKMGSVSEQVSVTGRVKPSKSVELAFEKGGKVTQVLTDVGRKVGTGQTLVVLEGAELSAQLREAEAGVKSAQAKLDELKRGTRQEEIQIQEVKISNARIALEDTRKNLVDKLQDAYTKSDDAVRGKTDQMFTNPQTRDPQLKFWVIDSSLENYVEGQRLSLEYNVFTKWKTSLDQLTTQSDFAAYITEAKKYLDEVKIFLDKLSLIVNNPNSIYLVNQISTEIPSSWKTDTATARTNINTAVTNITAAEEKFKTAESNLALYEQELTLKKAGTAIEQITAQEAQVEQVQAKVESLQAQIAKTILRSPISGVVTKQDAKVGELVSANTPVVWLISESQFATEANVPEADIAKIKIGNSVNITLDAYGDDVVFGAVVVAVDPAETMIEGVATYKVTMQFNENDTRIKSGMTANIDIKGKTQADVIIVPQQAIINRNGDKIVKVLASDNTVSEVKVEVGLRGYDGNIAIISGLNNGDEVILFQK